MKTAQFFSVAIVSIFLACTASRATIIGDIVVNFDDSNDENKINVTVSATPASLTPKFDFPMGPPGREDATVALRNVLSVMQRAQPTSSR